MNCVLSELYGKTAKGRFTGRIRFLKAIQGDLAYWCRYLNSDGVSTLVEAIHSGNTLPYDYNGMEYD